MRDKLLSNVNDAKLFWKTLKTVKSNVRHVSPICIDDWYKHFSNLFKSVDTDDNVPVVLDDDDDDDDDDDLFVDILDSPISKDEILKCIAELKCAKSPGLDNVIPEFIISGQDILLPYLELLFNIIFETGIFPKSW